MVGIVNRPHTRRMTPLRKITSTALFQFSLSHGHVPLFDTSEALPIGSVTLILSTLELLGAFNKLSTDAVWFVAIPNQR